MKKKKKSLKILFEIWCLSTKLSIHLLVISWGSEDSRSVCHKLWGCVGASDSPDQQEAKLEGIPLTFWSRVPGLQTENAL